VLSKLSTDEHTVGANFVSPSPSDGVESNEFVKAEAGVFFFRRRVSGEVSRFVCDLLH
jgi:hypothetical protein